MEIAVGDATNAHKAYVIFDTGGGPMLEPALSLTHCGRLIEITSAGDRRVSFDLIDFYHKESRLLGVDTRAYDAVTSGALLEARAFFKQATFRPPPIDRSFLLTDGVKACDEVERGQVRGRLVLAP